MVPGKWNTRLSCGPTSPLLKRHRLSLWLIALGLLLPTVTGAAEHWLSAAVNHRSTGLSVLVLSQEGRHFVRRLDLALLDIQPPGLPDRSHAGEWYFDSSRIEGYRLQVDAQAGTAHFIAHDQDHLTRDLTTPLLLDVTINGRLVAEPMLLELADGDLRFDRSALQLLGIDASALPAHKAPGLHQLAGEDFSLDLGRLRMSMTVPAELLSTTSVTMAPDDASVTVPDGAYSALLGYDINVGRDDSGTVWATGLLDLAISNGPGSCVHRQALRSEGVARSRRLDTACTWDWPHHLVSVTVGDAISAAGALGHPVRYGGVRVGTDFSLAPGMITQPTIALEGSARVPSTLELWVGQMLALRSELPPGPFSLLDIPVHSGAGEVRAVVTDALGRRQVISQQFYSDPVMLAPGLSQWSVDLGLTRVGFGAPDDHYGDEIAVVTGRRGIQSWLTLGGRAEAMADAHMIALAADLRVGRLGILELGWLGSQFDGESGNAGVFGFSRRGRRWSGGIRHFQSDPAFVQVGYPIPGSAPATSTELSIGMSLGDATLSVAGQRRHGHDDERLDFVSAAVNFPVGRHGNLTLSAFEPVAPAADTLFTAFLTLPLGIDSHVSASISGGQGPLDTLMTMQNDRPSGPGSGYRMSLGRRQGAVIGRGEYAVVGNRAGLTVTTDYHDGSYAAQVRVAGSVVATAAGIALSRQAAGSVAMIDLPHAGVRVYHDERVAAVTDGQGRAVVPGLRPYERNRLRVALDDLPLASRIGDVQVEVVPGRRQALQVPFQVESSRFVTANLHQPDGEPVPAGSSVRTGEPNEPLVTGHDGLVFLSASADQRMKLLVQWPGERCVAMLDLPAEGGDIIDLGPVTCHPESP